MTLVALSACNGCDEQPTEPPVAVEPAAAAEEEEAPPREGHVGTITGMVRLKADSELPTYAAEDIHGPQAMAEWTDNCPPFRDAQRATVRMFENRGLEGIVVYAGSEDRDAFFNALPEIESRRHEASIDACFLSPGTLSLTVGDTLVLTQNTREENFLPALAGSSFSDALPFGETREYAVEQGGITVLSCAFAAPCGRTDIVVHYHQVHTVTGPEGQFRLENVPADQTVEIVAWHPLFNYARGQVRVDENGEATLDLEVEAKPPPPEPEPVEPSELI